MTCQCLMNIQRRLPSQIRFWWDHTPRSRQEAALDHGRGYGCRDQLSIHMDSVIKEARKHGISPQWPQSDRKAVDYLCRIPVYDELSTHYVKINTVPAASTNILHSHFSLLSYRHLAYNGITVNDSVVQVVKISDVIADAHKVLFSFISHYIMWMHEKWSVAPRP